MNFTSPENIIILGGAAAANSASQEQQEWDDVGSRNSTYGDGMTVLVVMLLASAVCVRLLKWACQGPR